jgi:hypothetical protein
MRKGKDLEPDLDPYLPLTNGYGFGRPKNMQILRIRFRIRIPNTDLTTDERIETDNTWRGAHLGCPEYKPTFSE